MVSNIGKLLIAMVFLIGTSSVALAAGSPAPATVPEPASPGEEAVLAEPAAEPAPVPEADALEEAAPSEETRIFTTGTFCQPCLPECTSNAECEASCPPCPPFNAGYCDDEIQCEAKCVCFCA